MTSSRGDDVDQDELNDEFQRQRERLHELGNSLHAHGAKIAVLEGKVAVNEERIGTLTTRGETLALADRIKELKETAITRMEFSPVQKIVYGLAAAIMGGFIMAVGMLVYHAGVK